LTYSVQAYIVWLAGLALLLVAASQRKTMIFRLDIQAIPSKDTSAGGTEKGAGTVGPPQLDRYAPPEGPSSAPELPQPGAPYFDFALDPIHGLFRAAAYWLLSRH
jgi:hypothetical protein